MEGGRCRINNRYPGPILCAAGFDVAVPAAMASRDAPGLAETRGDRFDTLYDARDRRAFRRLNRNCHGR